MGSNDTENKGLGTKGRGQVGFLLAQIRAHATAKFAAKIKPLGITPAHAGMMRLLAHSAGLSQRELCGRLSILPSRLVILVDELDSKGLVKRQDDPNDRRSYALRLTEKGQKTMGSLGEIARAHGDAMCEGLNHEERTTLAAYLHSI